VAKSKGSKGTSENRVGPYYCRERALCPKDNEVGTLVKSKFYVSSNKVPIYKFRYSHNLNVKKILFLSGSNEKFKSCGMKNMIKSRVVCLQSIIRRWMTERFLDSLSCAVTRIASVWRGYSCLAAYRCATRGVF
jgi:hypothetical protein